MGSGEWRRGLGEEEGQASLRWSQVLRVSPPLLTAGDLKSVLGARMPPSPEHPCTLSHCWWAQPQALCSSLKGLGEEAQFPTPSWPRLSPSLLSQGGTVVSWAQPAPTSGSLTVSWDVTPPEQFSFPRAECARVVPTGRAPAPRGSCVTHLPAASHPSCDPVSQGGARGSSGVPAWRGCRGQPGGRLGLALGSPCWPRG